MNSSHRLTRAVTRSSRAYGWLRTLLLVVNQPVADVAYPVQRKAPTGHALTRWPDRQRSAPEQQPTGEQLLELGARVVAVISCGTFGRILGHNIQMLGKVLLPGDRRILTPVHYLRPCNSAQGLRRSNDRNNPV